MLSIIYLHGFASSPGSRKARMFAERFASLGVPLEIPQLVEGEFRDQTISAQLRLLERLAEGKPVSLIGSSMGGYLAALYAARHPEVRKLVLLAPAFGLARRWSDGLGPVEMERWRREGTRDYYHYALATNAPLGYRFMEDAAFYEDEPTVTQQTLVFHGIHDDVVPVEASRHFAHGRSNVELREVDSDHELIGAMDEILKASSHFLLA